jgi:hypothetical protein
MTVVIGLVTMKNTDFIFIIIGWSLLISVCSVSAVYGQTIDGNLTMTTEYPNMTDDRIADALANATSYLLEFQTFNDGCYRLAENEGVLNECALVFEEFANLMLQLEKKHGDTINKYVMAERGGGG